MTAPARSSRGARTEDVRRRNLSTVLRYVHVHGATARSRLTSDLGLNRSTIGDLTGELVSAHLVREVAGRSERPSTGPASSGGRPSFLVMPESEGVQVLAVEIGTTHLTVARVGLGGTVLARRDRAHRRGARERGIVSAVVRAGRELLGEIGDDVGVAGVGVAVPGTVRRLDGAVRLAPNLGWRDMPLGSVLAEALQLPVAVGNDADLGMRAEHVRGAAAGVQDAVYLAGHSGIGAGILAGGSLLGGMAGYAGEVGHIVVDAQGRVCHCGSRGCWETRCGQERLFELAGRPAGSGLAGVHRVAADAEAGDEVALRALQEVADWLGRGTAVLVNVLNPEVVIMGGALEEVHRVAGPTVQAAFEAATLAALLEQVRIVPPVLGPDSSLIGAAELAFEALLSEPLLALPRPRRA